jgi:predicted RNA methylase
MADFLKRLKGPPYRPWYRHLKRWRQVQYGDIRVHYKRHLEGGGRHFGQDFIEVLRRRGMPAQGRAFEWCAGPGFIGFSLLAHGLCRSLCLADLNEDSVYACRRTIRDNGLGDRVPVYHSDNLRSIPASEKWDLVVSNPPHFIDAYAGDWRAYDEDWHIHREFFDTVGNFLNPGGVIVLQENNMGSTVESFRGMIEDAGLSIVFVDDCVPERTPDHRFYYIGIMRRGDPPPAWANGA